MLLKKWSMGSGVGFAGGAATADGALEAATAPLSCFAIPASKSPWLFPLLPGQAGWVGSSRSTPAGAGSLDMEGMLFVLFCSSPGPTTLPEASRTSRTAFCGADWGGAGASPLSSCRQSRWMWVTFVLTPSLWTLYVGSKEARTLRRSCTLYFFFVLPTMRQNLSFTVIDGSPRIMPETSAMLTLLTLTSSTCVSVSPASICMHSSAEEPPTSSFTIREPSVPLRNIIPTPAKSFLSRKCTDD
mmetsp:Transcript_11668/g.28300  ORF Transcript_11668/g.28300 Transcript_11668/m.28300 type:complete len:243 (-) Transcript_11668:69-797(-)